MNKKKKIESSVEENRSKSGWKVLDGLESRYTCLSERPQNNYNNNNKRRYLTSLRVYGNREVEADEPPNSKSLIVFYLFMLLKLKVYVNVCFASFSIL
jgi:hypothetical protein